MNGVNDRFDFTRTLPELTDISHAHLVAIGGAGMSAVARLLLDRGVRVSGSDRAESPATRDLAARGARIHLGHAAGQVSEADIVVVSSAVPADNVELVAARARLIPVLHRSQALAMVMQDATRIAVAGANGKTTTTSLLTEALMALGRSPSFASGGELVSTGANARIGSGAEFVVEADESDGSFVVYHPEIAVITSVQADHLDFYTDLDHVEQAYREFARTVPRGGLLVVCADDPGAAEVARVRRSERARTVCYGESADAGVSISEIVSGPDGVQATVAVGHERGDLVVGMPGRHNALNAAAVVAVLTVGLGIPLAQSLQALARSGGARRRFDVAGTVNGVTVVDDYAHNPAKVAAAVATARDVAGQARVLVIFQPHLYSRTADFADEFAAALATADDVVLLPIYGAREEPVPGVSSELIGTALREDHGVAAHLVADTGEAVRHVVSGSREGDVVMTVGAGDVTRLVGAIVHGLRERTT